MNFTNTTTASIPVTVSYYAKWIPTLALISKRLNFWGVWTILVPGVILNFVSAGIFLRKRFWKNTTMGYYYSVQPLMSNVFLSFGALTFLTIYYGQDLSLKHFSACVISYGARLSLVMGCEYIQVQMSVDRALNIMYPKRFPWLTKPINLAKITILIYLIIWTYAFTLQGFRTYSYASVVQGNITVLVPTNCGFTGAPLLANNFLYFCVRTLGYLINMIANMLIINKLIQSKKNSTKRSASNEARISTKELTFAFSLMSCNFFQVAFVVPFLIVNLIQLTYALNPKAPADMVTFYNLLFAITTWGSYIYEAILFWLNLGTNKIFRAELRIGKVEQSTRFTSTANQNSLNNSV